MDNHGDGKQEQFKKEMRSDMEKGLAFVKRGVVAFQKMAGELAEEGKRQYAVAATKSKIRDAKRDLGARVYTLLSKAETQNPALDEGVKGTIARIRGLEEELAKLEVKVASAQPAGPAPGSEGGDPAKAEGKADEAPRP
jgi:hypothetical protein